MRSSKRDTPPTASSPLVSVRMRATPTRNTKLELLVRRELWRRGLRYRVDVRPLASLPRRADVVFPRLRVAVFLDGCYWHHCPAHGQIPKANAAWWQRKFAETARRDRETSSRLAAAKWTVVRIWEHESIEAVVRTIESALAAARLRPELEARAEPRPPERRRR